MSFFDEADEPQPTLRTEPRRPRSMGRPPRGPGRPPGGSGRPPRGPGQQDVQTRRLVAAGVVVVVVLVLALLIKGCESSAATSALKNYNADVYHLIDQSTTNGVNALGLLKPGSAASAGTTTQLATAASTARTQLRQAERLNAPGQMAGAQSALIDVMRLRAQGLGTIARYAQQTANKNTSQGAVSEIALGTSDLYGSDVLYKEIVAKDLAKVLKQASIPVGTNSGQQPINPRQIVQDLGWLQTSWITNQVGAKLTIAEANVNNMQANLDHGDGLESVTVDGTTLSPTGTNTVPASNAQTWALGVLDAGQSRENQVTCKLTIEGANDSATATIPTIGPGQTLPCTVHLPRKPPTGAPYRVTATVEKVPLESDLKNNTYHYTVTFN